MVLPSSTPHGQQAGQSPIVTMRPAESGPSKRKVLIPAPNVPSSKKRAGQNKGHVIGKNTQPSESASTIIDDQNDKGRSTNETIQVAPPRLTQSDVHESTNAEDEAALAAFLESRVTTVKWYAPSKPPTLQGPTPYQQLEMGQAG